MPLALPVKPITLVLTREGHSFSKTENEKAWYDALVAFLAEHNPADQPDLIGESGLSKRASDPETAPAQEVQAGNASQ